MTRFFFPPPDFGLWTPELGFSGGNGTLALTYAADSQEGWWERHGYSVRIGFKVQTASFTLGSATGNLQISGSPWTNRNVAGHTEVGPVTWQGLTKAGFTQVNANIQVNTSVITFIAMGSGQGATSLGHLDTLASPILLRGHVDIRLVE